MADLEPIENETGETAEVQEHTRLPIPPNRPRKVSSSMWGPLEIGAVTIASLALLLAALAYFFFVLPSSRELAKNRSEADRLEAELTSANSKYGEITNTETQVAKLVASVDDFEARFLPVPATGQAALYQRLNGLIAAYGLTNTTGPDYSPLESAEIRQTENSEEEKGRAKYRSLYPGVYVSTTLEGSYQNLRRFIREIETGREFIVVSAVELAPSETEQKRDTNKPNANPAANTGQVNPANPNFAAPNGRAVTAGPNAVGGLEQTAGRAKNQGKMHGETVSLHIEMAAYFRRPKFASTGQ